jgi:sodium/potassium-transporting ATPase subunit alpha
MFYCTQPISQGNRVPADIRIVEASSDLRFDRSLLTGERLVIYFIFCPTLFSSSTSDMIPGTVLPTSDNAMETRNLALNSTFVVQGKCTGVVFATGDRTIMGRIVAMSGDTKFKLTTVQKEVWFFTKIISAVALGLFCISMIVWAAWLRNAFPGFENASEAIINSIGCLTAFVPQVCILLTTTYITSYLCRFCRVYRYALRCPSLSLLDEWPLVMSSLRILQLSKH